MDQVDNPVSYFQFRAFMKDVMGFLFTDYLLGEENIKLIINKLVHSSFNICRDEPLTKVGWLESFSFETARILQCIIGFLFLTKYDIIELKWKKLSAAFLQRFIESRKAKQVQDLPNDHYYLMWFVPKSKELSAREYLKIVNRVLVCVTKSYSFGFGIDNLKEFGHHLRIFAARNSSVKKFYCFSGDINNCSPTIEHDFLTKSLNEIIPNSGPFVYAKYYATLKNGRILPTGCCKTLNDAKMNLMKRCKYVSDSCKDMKIITKSELIETIQRYAMKNVFRFENKIYQCFR